MHENLMKVSRTLGLELPNIDRAAASSDQVIDAASESACQYLVDEHVILPNKVTEGLELGLVAFGSLGRRELSVGESDFDYAIVAYGTVERPEDMLQYRLGALRAQTAMGLRKPGQSRLFGGIISAADLVNRIGLEDDTNRTHTQRMLFLEESVPLLDRSSHEKTMRSILKRYLVDYHNFESTSPLHKRGVARFLLNDVVRYWRTVAVDYQAKRWDELSPPAGAFQEDDGLGLEPPKWGLRYIKLRSSRKLAFVGTLVSLLMPRISDQEVTHDVLFEQFSRPPLARLAQLIDVINDDDYQHLHDVFAIADEFAGCFDNPEFRQAVAQVEHPRDPGDNATFRDARMLTESLQEALELLFRSPRPLKSDAPPVRGYEEPLSLAQLAARYLLF